MTRIKGSPPSDFEVELYAARAASALKKMPDGDRREVLAAVPETIDPVARIAAADLDAELIQQDPAQLADRIRRALAEHSSAALDSAHRAGLEEKHELAAALKKPEVLEAIRAGAKPLMHAFHQEGVTVEQLDHLVTELELLQDLHGGRDLSQVNDRRVHEAMQKLGNPDLVEVLRTAGKELASAVYAGLESEVARELG